MEGKCQSGDMRTEVCGMSSHEYWCVSGSWVAICGHSCTEE